MSDVQTTGLDLAGIASIVESLEAKIAALEARMTELKEQRVHNSSYAEVVTLRERMVKLETQVASQSVSTQSTGGVEQTIPEFT